MNQPTFPIEAIAMFPLPGAAIPRAFTFSPDDALIACLHSGAGDLSQQLYAIDPATGARRILVEPPDGGDTEATLSLEEKLRRERLRLREVGITQYAWSRQGALLIPLSDGLYLQEPGQPLRQLVAAGDAPILDPRFAPDGSAVAYVQDAELYVVPVAGGEARQITTGARGTGKTHGLAEYAAQEEMGRMQGYWWSPNSQCLAFTEVDETHIPLYHILHQGKDTVGEGAQEAHHYPFAGAENARVRLGVVSRDGEALAWLDLGDAEYLARVAWLADGNLTAQLENREQTELRLVRFDPATNAGHTLLTETSAVWINLHTMFKPLNDGRFIWASERTGFMHLYLYAADGTLIRPLTQGEWQVDNVEGVDEEHELVYFTAAEAHPTERQLYAVALAGGPIHRITEEPGTHLVVLDHACTHYIAIHSALDQPPTVTLRALADGSLRQTLYAEPDPRIAALGLTPPEQVTLLTRDGVTLHGLLYRPAGAGPFPTLVSVYGGPHAQRAINAWGATVDLRAQYLRSLGFAVFVLDNRGSARRGLAFEGSIKHNLGDLEVQDQVDGVRWLTAQGIADPARVGVYGWSYGGYMALMCLARAPETFKAGVAGAPVTAWDGYDTHYTERYMGTPQQNPAGYHASSVMQHIETLTGNLLLVHGLIDENVHFRHTARLINALIRARKPYALLLFPDERHMPRGLSDRIYMEERIRDFFQANLQL